MNDLRSWSPAPRRTTALLTGLSLLVALAAMLVVVLASATDGGAVAMLLAAAAVGALVTVQVLADRQVVRPLPAPVRAGGVARAVPASTAYWCAVPAPRSPLRPRAPGRG